jgi:hypothetical protein
MSNPPDLSAGSPSGRGHLASVSAVALAQRFGGGHRPSRFMSCDIATLRYAYEAFNRRDTYALIRPNAPLSGLGLD